MAEPFTSGGEGPATGLPPKSPVSDAPAAPVASPATPAPGPSQGASELGRPAPTSEREREFTVEARSQARLILARFVAHRLAVASLLVLLVLILLALAGGRLWRYSYAVPTDDLSSPPSLTHPMGTNGIGIDTFAQVLRGAQKSVQVALLVALLSTTLGAVLGSLAGYCRGFVDSALMWFTDVALTIPLIAFLVMLSAQVGRKAGSWFYIALVIAAFLWMPIARVVRGVVLSLREREFVEAARALGASDRRIIFRHLLPNAAGPIIVNATVAVAFAILTETALSYLGVGIQPPDTSLGALVSEGQGAATTRPWLFYFPGLFIVLICLTINFVGDGLRDALDPTQTRVRA